MSNKDVLIQKLESIVEDYKKFQKESKELLGLGYTDKRYVAQKKKMIDERLKKLKSQWVETLTALDPTYGQIYKRTAPTIKTLNAIKQMENK